MFSDSERQKRIENGCVVTLSNEHDRRQGKARPWSIQMQGSSVHVLVHSQAMCRNYYRFVINTVQTVGCRWCN